MTDKSWEEDYLNYLDHKAGDIKQIESCGDMTIEKSAISILLEYHMVMREELLELRRLTGGWNNDR